jgi:hypothetical protein
MKAKYIYESLEDFGFDENEIVKLNQNSEILLH